MAWKLLPDEGGYRCLGLEASWEEVEPDYQELLTQYAAQARLPGFRPGKAPRPVVEQRLRKAIGEDLSARVVGRLGRDAARQAGLEALGPLEATEVECQKGKPLYAKIRYLPFPDFELPDLTGLYSPEEDRDPRDQISARLLERVTFEVPAPAVRRELDLDGLGESLPGSEAWREAAERVRLMLILKRIARREGIEVDDRDVERRVAEKAEEFGESPTVLREELEGGPGKERLRDMLLAESVLDYLMEKQSS